MKIQVVTGRDDDLLKIPKFLLDLRLKPDYLITLMTIQQIRKLTAVAAFGFAFFCLLWTAGLSRDTYIPKNKHHDLLFS